MKESAGYAKIVEWSDEDQSYVGSCPALLIGGCCHGDDEKKVFAELCDIVEETIQMHKDNNIPLPPRLPPLFEAPLNKLLPNPNDQEDRPLDSPEARLLEILKPRFSSPERADAWYRSKRIPCFGATAEQLVRQGRTEEVLEYLEASDAGVYA